MKKYIKLLIIILPLILIFLLSINSFYSLSFVRRRLGDYTFMVSKKFSYNEDFYGASIKYDDIINSSIVVYNGSYDVAKSMIADYKFYNCIIDFIEEKEFIYNSNKTYYLEKKLTYRDNNEITYMLNYLYQFDNNKVLVVSIESESMGNYDFFLKNLKKMSKTIKLYH